MRKSIILLAAACLIGMAGSSFAATKTDPRQQSQQMSAAPNMPGDPVTNTQHARARHHRIGETTAIGSNPRVAVQISEPPRGLTELAKNPRFIAAAKARRFAAIRQMIEVAGGQIGPMTYLDCPGAAWGPVYYPYPQFLTLGNGTNGPIYNHPPGTWMMGWICGGGSAKNPITLYSSGN